LDRLEQDFPLDLSQETRDFIAFIDRWEADRYFVYSFGLDGLELMRLDRAVWEIRRYCTHYNQGKTPNGTSIGLLDLKHIERASDHPPQQYRPLSEGFLDEILQDKDSRARPALIWQNLYFGKTSRRPIHNFQRQSYSANSSLDLYSDLLDEVAKYVYLPKGIRPSTLKRVLDQNEQRATMAACLMQQVLLSARQKSRATLQPMNISSRRSAKPTMP
jgi:hypothetical protein